jgi:hypothetical protein
MLCWAVCSFFYLSCCPPITKYYGFFYHLTNSEILFTNLIIVD